MRLLKKILKKILVLLLLYIAIILFTFFYFLIKKDQIAEELLLSINKQINGEVSFTDISFHPFKQFPSVSLVLNNFSFYQSSDTIHDILENPIAEFVDVYIAFDILDLLDKKITITKVIFENGSIDLIKYPNEKINILMALALRKIQNFEPKQAPKILNNEKVKTLKKVKPNKHPSISKTIKLKLNQIKLVDANITYNNQKNGNQSSFLLHKMLASLSLMPDSIVSSLVLKTEIKKLEVFDKWNFDDLELEIQTSLSMNRRDSLVKFEQSKILYRGTEFRLDGIIDFKRDGFVDFNMRGLDEGLGFLSLLLTKSGVENITSGKFMLKGKLKGSLKEEIPELSIDFGVEDLSLKIPSGTDSIKNFNMHGTFLSGNKEDLSLAILKIDTLNGLLPGGYVDGIFEMQNLTEPQIGYKIDLKANIEGLENVIQQNYIDSLKGFIDFHDEFKGVLFLKRGWVDEKKGNLTLKFDSASFQIPGAIKIDNISGSVTNRNSRVQLNKIKIQSGKSDLQINGDIRNLPNLIFDEGKRIITNLTIKSKLFVLKDFLPFDTINRPGFSYRFRNFGTKIRLSASNSDLKEYKITPAFQLSIQDFHASIDSFLVPFTIKKGNITLSEIEGAFLLHWFDFDIRSGAGKLKLNGNYKQQKGKAPRLNTLLNVRQINLTKIFYTGLIDSNISLLNSDINGNVNLNFGYTNDENKKINQAELSADSLNFKEGKNVLQLHSLRFIAGNISFGHAFGKNPLASLNAKMELGAKRIWSNYYKVNNVFYKINANNGTYTITPENDSWFGVKASGKFIVSPFKDIPTYSFDYSVKQFSLGKLFANFLEDSLLTGKMDFALKLNFNGSTKDSILKSMRGNVHVRGNNLVLYGLDIDDFLKNFQQNKNFSLFDIGLVLYAGPLGLLTGKRKDLAKIEVTDWSKKSRIINLVSDWSIKNDSLIADDIAFTTKNNRIALNGKYSYNADILDFNIALLDYNGCSILNQRFVGLSDKPKMVGKNGFNKVSASGANLIKQKAKTNCNPFYKGSLAHPKGN